MGEVIYHCPGFQWSMRVGACGESQILLAATSPAGSALSKNMAGVYGVSSTFPNMLTDEIHLSLTSERTFFFPCYYLEEQRAITRACSFKYNLVSREAMSLKSL